MSVTWAVVEFWASRGRGGKIGRDGLVLAVCFADHVVRGPSRVCEVVSKIVGAKRGRKRENTDLSQFRAAIRDNDAPVTPRDPLDVPDTLSQPIQVAKSLQNADKTKKVQL